MNEDEWLTGTDFTAHTRYATDLLSPRRQRLLAAGFCRAVADLFDKPELTEALDVIERYADGRVPPAEVERVRHRCREIAQEAYENYIQQGQLNSWLRSELAWALAFAAATPFSAERVGSRAATAAVQASTQIIQMIPVSSTTLDVATASQYLTMRGVVWEVVGNPFHPPHFSREWRTDTVLSLASQMYDSREFSAMPILADALQDAGCDNDEVLHHCRSEATHLRGCWVLDLVLVKE